MPFCSRCFNEYVERVGDFCASCKLRKNIARTFIAAAMLLMPTTALASSDCKSMREARSIWPDVYLKYHIEGRRSGGRKCWYAPGEKTKRDTPPVIVNATPAQAVSRISDGFQALMFFLPRPEVVEDEPALEPRKLASRKKHHTRVALARVPSVDERIRWLCGDLNHAYCSESFRELAREQRGREARRR